eukprot:gene2129-4156_t
MLGVAPKLQDRVRPVQTFLVTSMLVMVLCDRCQRNEELISGDLQPSTAEFRGKLAKLTARSIPLRKVVNALRILVENHEPHWVMAPIKASCVEFGSPTPWMSSGVSKLLHMLLQTQRAATDVTIAQATWSRPPSQLLDFRSAIAISGSLVLDVAVAVHACVVGWQQELSYINALVQQAMVPVIEKEEVMPPRYIGTSLNVSDKRSMNQILTYFENQGREVDWNELTTKTFSTSVPSSFLSMDVDELQYHLEATRKDRKRQQWKDDVGAWREEWDWKGIAVEGDKEQEQQQEPQLQPPYHRAATVDSTSLRNRLNNINRCNLSRRPASQFPSGRSESRSGTSTPMGPGQSPVRLLVDTSAWDRTMSERHFEAGKSPSGSSPSPFSSSPLRPIVQLRKLNSPYASASSAAYENEVEDSSVDEGMGMGTGHFGRPSPLHPNKGSAMSLSLSSEAFHNLQLGLRTADLTSRTMKMNILGEFPLATSPLGRSTDTFDDNDNDNGVDRDVMPSVAKLINDTAYLRQKLSSEPHAQQPPHISKQTNTTTADRSHVILREDGTWRSTSEVKKPSIAHWSPSDPCIVTPYSRMPESSWVSPVPGRHQPCLIDLLNKNGSTGVLERVKILTSSKPPTADPNLPVEQISEAKMVRDQLAKMRSTLRESINVDKTTMTMRVRQKASSVIENIQSELGLLTDKERSRSPVRSVNEAEAAAMIQISVNRFVDNHLVSSPPRSPAGNGYGYGNANDNDNDNYDVSSSSPVRIHSRLNLSRTKRIKDDSLMFRAPTPCGIHNRNTLDLTHFIGLRSSEIPDAPSLHALNDYDCNNNDSDNINRNTMDNNNNGSSTPHTYPHKGGGGIDCLLLRDTMVSPPVFADIVKRFMQPPQLQVLLKLDISGNRLGRNGIAPLLQALRVNSHLVEISLANNGLGDAGLREFLEAVKEGGGVLDLSWNSIACDTKNQRDLLSSIINGLQELQVLSLAYNRLLDRGLGVVVGSCASIKSLKVLDMAYCFYTEKSVITLKPFLKSAKVDIVLLQGISLSRKSLEEIKACIQESGKRVLLEGHYGGIDLTLHFEGGTSQGL